MACHGGLSGFRQGSGFPGTRNAATTPGGPAGIDGWWAAPVGVAVADARMEARQAADWITPNPGGMGAVRDVCDWILRK